ncbi:MAG: flagellar protein FliT [Firmicutes bacterium]|nr:flagellar protein FliT [Bacillota bacterium]
MDRLTLLSEKKDVYNNILALTRKFAVTGEDSDVDEYSALMARRRCHINRIKAIDRELERIPPADRPAEEALSREAAGVLRAIVALDEEISAKTPYIMDMLKKRLRDITASRNISNSYACGENKGSGLLLDTRF